MFYPMPVPIFRIGGHVPYIYRKFTIVICVKREYTDVKQNIAADNMAEEDYSRE